MAWRGEKIALAQALAEMGSDYLVVNCDMKGSWDNRERKTEDELRLQGENLTQLAEQIASLGLDLVVHNHAVSNDLHMDDLRSVTEFAGESVGVCLDTGWAQTSGDEPISPPSKSPITCLPPRIPSSNEQCVPSGRPPGNWILHRTDPFPRLPDNPFIQLMNNPG
jgi:hypothetical protein